MHLAALRNDGNSNVDAWIQRPRIHRSYFATLAYRRKTKNSLPTRSTLSALSAAKILGSGISK